MNIIEQTINSFLSGKLHNNEPNCISNPSESVINFYFQSQMTDSYKQDEKKTNNGYQ